MLPILSHKYNECPSNLLKSSSILTPKSHINHKNKSIQGYYSRRVQQKTSMISQKQKQNLPRLINHPKSLQKYYHNIILPKSKSPQKKLIPYQLERLKKIEKQCKKLIKQKNQFENQNICNIMDFNHGNTIALSENDQIIYQNLAENTNNGFSRSSTESKIKYCGNILNTQQQIVNNITIKKIVTSFKPPHRYKTSMAITKNCLILYGGLGCEKDLSWAKLKFDDMRWNIGKSSDQNNYLYKPQTPIYGHTMVSYKDKLIIYGGICSTEINETTIIKTNKMTIQQGQRGPSRRKNHAAIIIGDYMLIHGGIQIKQTKSDFLAYNIQQNKWSVINGNNYPALSCHKMVTLNQKKKSKGVYIFGGISDKGKCKNKMYMIKMISDKQIKCEQIKVLNPPEPRHSFCLEAISTNQLLLYGGKQIQQTSNQTTLKCGIFNDIHLYNTQNRSWSLIQTKNKMPHSFGMASSSISGRIFIFGGSTSQNYCDATIYILGIGANQGLQLDRNGFETQNRIRFSNRTLISKHILND